MSTTRIVFSGYGGQGILTLGQIIASIGMNQEKKVTWMPSYGAEMRGGTANCAVIISDNVIGSPMVISDIDILVAMNMPSLDKFLSKVKSGGTLLINSSIINYEIARDDITIIKIDASNIATHIGDVRVANMVMVSGFLHKTELFTMPDIRLALEEKFKSKKPGVVDLNIKAIEQGLESIR